MNKSRYVFFILACLFGLYVQAQNRTVKGRVLSAEDKEPLIGATVKIPGTSIGVVTDIDGNFSLEVPDKDKTLVIEFFRYEYTNGEDTCQWGAECIFASGYTTIG